MQGLSKTTGYAILALSCLDGREGLWVLAKDIADCTDIPRPYLSRILHALGRKGMIQTKRGYRGGVTLSRPASEITLYEVAEAVEQSLARPQCMLGLAECSDERACPAHEFWVAQRTKIRNQLQGITLADISKFESRPAGRLKNTDSLEGGETRTRKRRTSRKNLANNETPRAKTPVSANY